MNALEFLVHILLEAVAEADKRTCVALLLFKYLAALFAGALAVVSVYLRYGDDLEKRVLDKSLSYILEDGLIHCLVAEAGHIPYVSGLAEIGEGMTEAAYIVDSAADSLGELVPHSAVVFQLCGDHLPALCEPIYVTVLKSRKLGAVNLGNGKHIHLRNALAGVGVKAASAALLEERINAVKRAAHLGTEDKQAFALGLDGKALFAELLLALAAAVRKSDHYLMIGLLLVIRLYRYFGIGDLFEISRKLFCSGFLRSGMILTYDYYILGISVVCDSKHKLLRFLSVSAEYPIQSESTIPHCFANYNSF